MKAHLLILMMLGNFYVATAQITTPIVKANFGIDGDLGSNIFNNSNTGNSDDWFNNGTAGSGQFVIDTTGAAAIVAGYASNPASRNWSFARLMRQQPYQIVNGNLLLDAIFHRDYHGDDSTIFASGSNKNGMSPNAWTSPTSQSVPDKNEILDAYTHIRRAGTTTTDSLWMFNGISIENTTGSRYFDFELYQTDIFFDKTNRTFQNYGPDAGHTSWQFDASGNILKPGDIIFTAEFGTSGIKLVEARIWIDKASLGIVPSTFVWGGDFDGASSKAVYGYASILPKTAGEFYTGLQCTDATWAGAFALVRSDNSVVTDYISGQFMEFSVNLTKLGIEPASFSNNNCGSPFRRVLIKTRSSTSFTSELKDFIAPFRMFDYPTVKAYSQITYFCGTMPQTQLSAFDPLSTSVYTWTTPNGNIVGAATGASITVDAPGKYYVTQQLNAACPYYAKDSITLMFDAVCKTLNAAITNFEAVAASGEVNLNWQVDNNELTDKHIIEYSTDNKLFKQLIVIPSLVKTGVALYNYKYLPESTQPVFYRIKVLDKNGALKYSRTILVKQGSSLQNAPVIYPNPIADNAWVSLNASKAGTLVIMIYDITGRLTLHTEKKVAKGLNIIQLQALADQSAGLYLVKLKGPDGGNIQKISIGK